MAKIRKIRIAEAARLAGVTKTTLQHWHNYELLDLKNDDDNNYHLFDDNAFTNIAHIKLYRQIGLTCREIKNLPNMDFPTQRQMYLDKSDNIDKQIANLKSIKAKTEKLIEEFEEFATLREKGFVEEEPPFDKVVEFDFEDPKLMHLLMNENTSSIIISVISLSHENDSYLADFHGILPLYETGDFKVLWTKPEKAIWIKYALFIDLDNAQDNEKQHYQKLKEIEDMGYELIEELAKPMFWERVDKSRTLGFICWVKVRPLR